MHPGFDHSVTLQDMAVLAGRDDNIHNHPLIKSLGMKSIISSFAAVKSRFAALQTWQNVIVRSYTWDSGLNHSSDYKKNPWGSSLWQRVPRDFFSPPKRWLNPESLVYLKTIPPSCQGANMSKQNCVTGRMDGARCFFLTITCISDTHMTLFNNLWMTILNTNYLYQRETTS